MADDAQQEPRGSFTRMLHALVASLVQLYARIFHSTAGSQHEQQPQQNTPQTQQQQQQNPAQQVAAARPADEEASAGTAPDALTRGQTIRRVPPDYSLEALEPGRTTGPEGEESTAHDEYHHSNDDIEAEMAGGKSRGGGRPYRPRSAHSQGQTLITTGINGAVGTPSANSPPAAQSINSGRPESAAGSNSPATKILAPGQSRTNGAAISIGIDGQAQTAPSVIDTEASTAKVTPVVKLPPKGPFTEQAKSEPGIAVTPDTATVNTQKENAPFGYTDAAGHHLPPPAPVPNLAVEDASVAAERKPTTTQAVVLPPNGTQDDTEEVAKAAEKDTPVSLPTPIIIPLPYTMKPIPPKLLGADMPGQILPGLIEPKTPEERAEREYHLKYMRAALDMGQLALETNETPVGCVLVWRDQIIAKGMNATNITRNGTRHAEFMALSALLSRKEKGDIEDMQSGADFDESTWGDVDPKDGHIFPYGQKLHPAPVVDRSIVNECILYVTVEPCVMCASLLRQLGIKKVYFGAVNDKFGGTGGVFRIHMNSKPVPRPTDRPYQNGYGPAPVEKTTKPRPGSSPREDDDGDGGNVEPGFPAEGGYLRDEAVSLLRRFYVQENGRAPQPRKKEGRAARLFAMEAEAQALKSSASEISDSVTAPQTPVESEAAKPSLAAAAVKEESA